MGEFRLRRRKRRITAEVAEVPRRVLGSLTAICVTVRCLTDDRLAGGVETVKRRPFEALGKQAAALQKNQEADLKIGSAEEEPGKGGVKPPLQRRTKDGLFGLDEVAAAVLGVALFAGLHA